ncbi:MAG: AraC-like DNA-binding protein [Porticoccaceae bacterium]|jgi:AraC-like DNA-binding protein
MTIKTSKQESAPSFVSETLYQSFRDIFEPLLNEIDIPRTVLTDSSIEVSLAKHCDLMELAAEKLGNENLGLQIGSKVQPRYMGPLGYTILNSPNVLNALQNFCRYLHVYARGCDMALETDDKFAYFSFSYSIIDPGPIGRRHEAECTLAMVKNVIEVVTESKWKIEEVFFEHPTPTTTIEHKRTFGAPVHFSQQVNQLKFDKNILERKLPQADPRLFEVLEGHLKEALENQTQEDDIVSSVGIIIAKSLSNGIPSVDDVAASLFMSKRTLQRRLYDRGVLFNEYADEIRCKMAQQFVAKTKLSLTEVAFLLGYAHISALSRAFRRWTGKTPYEFRAEASNNLTPLP